MQYYLSSYIDRYYENIFQFWVLNIKALFINVAEEKQHDTNIWNLI